MADSATDITIRAKYTDLGVSRGLTGMLGMVRGLIGPLAAVFSIGAAISFVKSMAEAGGAIEKYRTRLRVLLGSVEEANRLLALMKTYAEKSGQPFEGILESATMLSGVMKGGVNEINSWMPLIGDLAASTGMGIEEVTNQIIRMYDMGTGSAIEFRRRGVLTMLGFQEGITYSVAETRKKLLEAWTEIGSKFRGTAEAMKSTWGGAMSNLHDAWFDFKVTLFDAFKGTLKDIADATTGMVRTATEKFALLALNAGAIMASLKNAIELYFSDWDFMENVTASLWIEFSFLVDHIIETAFRCLVNLALMVSNLAATLWWPIEAMFLFLLDSLKYYFKSWLNWLMDKLEALDKWSGVPVIKLSRFELGIKPSMQENWAASGEAMKAQLAIIVQDNEQAMEDIRNIWKEETGSGLKKSLAPAMVQLKGLEEAIDKVVAKTTQPPGSLWIDLKQYFDVLINKANELANLYELIGKGLLGSKFENQIKADILGTMNELKKNIDLLARKPMSKEHLEYITKLSQAYEGLRKLSQNAIDFLIGKSEVLNTMSQGLFDIGILSKGILDKTFDIEIIKQRTAIIGDLVLKIKELAALPKVEDPLVNLERFKQLTQLISAYDSLTQNFEYLFNAAVGFKAKMITVFEEMAKHIKQALPNAVLQCVEQMFNAFSGFFSDLASGSKGAAKNFAANIIGALATLATFLGTLIFLAGIGFVGLGWVHAGGPAIAAGLGLMALGGLGQGLAIRLRQQNEEKISDQQEQQKALNEGVARNVPGGITNRTEVTVRVQDDSGRSILDARGQREAQKIVLLALKGAQDQGKLAVNVV